MINKAVLDRDPTLAEIVRRLVHEFHPVRIFLFGSQARADAGENSDYDILVVMPTTTEAPSYRLVQRAHRYTLRGIPAPVDIVIITESQFNAKKTVIGTVPESAIHEGKELYAA